MYAVRLIATDMDGTLLNSSHALTERTINIFRRVSEMGIRICLISARPPNAIVSYADELKVPVVIAAYNGAYILSEDRSLLHEQWLEFEPRIEAVKMLKANFGDINISAYIGERWLIDKLDPYVEQEQSIASIPFERANRIEDLPETDRVHKLLVMGEASDISRAEILMEERFGSELTVTRSKEQYLELSPRTVSKGKTLAYLSKRFDISAVEMAAFGDNDNDADMLAYAGTGVAMSNASLRALEAADVTTLSNDKDGVAIFIENIIIPLKKNSGNN
jgi:Cof subfamily protein (haloacid dehalogenase superfamily)